MVLKEEASNAAAKCNATLSSLERDAAEVDALRQGLDRRHRQAERNAEVLAANQQALDRCPPPSVVCYGFSLLYRALGSCHEGYVGGSILSTVLMYLCRGSVIDGTLPFPH